MTVPPEKAYALSHQTQRSEQPVSRTNVQGRPANDVSPCRLRKISVTVSAGSSAIGRDDSASNRIIGPVRIRLELAYLGTFFEGWQVQAPRADEGAVRTVQGLLEDSLKGTYGTDIRVHGAGRTDSGVHADGQVAHFDVPDGAPLIPSQNIPRALNSKLPWDLRVLSAAEASGDFHARRSAAGKVYVYRLRRGDLLQPHRGLVEALAPERLDVGAMRAAAERLIGTRDFAPFSITGSEPGSTVRTLRRLDVVEEDSLLVITAEGDGFLRGMVRRLVGTLRDAGRGHIPPEEATSRPGPTAEARGLTLARVLYPGESRGSGGSAPASAR
jgi:tRNA pseudouridine38-40 synthase